MLQGPWVMGDTYTICDPYLFTIAQWLEGDSVDPARFPKVKAHRDRMSERAAVRKAVAANRAENRRRMRGSPGLWPFPTTLSR